MRVIKKINHNVVLVDDNSVEKIAMGKGIGFSVTPGERFDVATADKLFVLDTQEKVRMFTEMAKQIPLAYIEFSEEMIQFIAREIASPLDSNIYISLTDHIYFAIQRQKEDSQVTAIMLPEMKLLYPEEYRVAAEVVEKINTRYLTELGDNEIGFITMHIINAELGERNSLNSLKIIEISTAIIHIIEEQYNKILDKESLSYNRMLIHLKFLVKRLIYQEEMPEEEITFINQTFKKSKQYRTAELITKFIKQTYQLDVKDNETIYLAIHLARI
ncbi:PRD domain-containing protein [Vagococcus sp. BWB3-3]|uniref:PRD domain-containing protein n=1 Tax=Vagococcus allomyrinae TaxID=2794353 RepID=A0A940SW99_9ENTE|nr:PRD domain-containing protein [Vagococcus allomyrinae]MBP1041861.1 PRD domain-containing protein [Vagococcus allomyrinae]